MKRTEEQLTQITQWQIISSLRLIKDEESGRSRDVIHLYFVKFCPSILQIILIREFGKEEQSGYKTSWKTE